MSDRRFKRTIHDEEHSAIVLKVLSSYPDGRPKTCEILHEDMSTKLDAEQVTVFIVAWAPTKTLQKKG